MLGADDDKVLPEEIVRKLRSMNWDERLEKARAERVRALAQAQGGGGPAGIQHLRPGRAGLAVVASDPVPAEPEAEAKPAPAPVRRKRPRGPIRVMPLVIVAMVLGAGLQWGAGRVMGVWQTDDAVPVALAGVGAVPAKRAGGEISEFPGSPIQLLRSDAIAMDPPAVFPVIDHSVFRGPRPPDLTPASVERGLAVAGTGPQENVVGAEPLPDAGAAQIEIGLFIPARLSAEMAGNARGILTRDGTNARRSGAGELHDPPDPGALLPPG